MNAPAPLYGLVLTGGRSRRFGRDKAAFEIAGETLLQRTVELLAPLVAELRVSVRPDQVSESHRAAYPLLVDQLADGPGAGLLAAHAHAPAAAWLVLACDLPRLNAELLLQLIEARDPGRAATAFRSPVNGRPEPLCAIYEPATLAAFRRQVDAGAKASPRDLLEAADVALIDAQQPSALTNMNRPADLSNTKTEGFAR